jgi:large subunit ribosomal protein L35
MDERIAFQQTASTACFVRAFALINPPFEPPGSSRAAVAVLSLVRKRTGAGFDPLDILFRARPDGDEQMPKLKTKSGAKKRFKLTGTGKVVYAQRGKRHGMIKRTNKQIRNLRGTNVLFKTDGDNVKKFFLPNS